MYLGSQNNNFDKWYMTMLIIALGSYDNSVRGLSPERIAASPGQMEEYPRLQGLGLQIAITHGNKGKRPKSVTIITAPSLMQTGVGFFLYEEKLKHRHPWAPHPVAHLPLTKPRHANPHGRDRTREVGGGALT